MMPRVNPIQRAVFIVTDPTGKSDASHSHIWTAAANFPGSSFNTNTSIQRPAYKYIDYIVEHDDHEIPLNFEARTT